MSSPPGGGPGIPPRRSGLRRRPLGLGLVLVVLALAGWGGWAAWRQLRAAHHHREAHRALEQRDFARARQHLASCLTVWPNDVALHLLSAQAARRAGDLEEATRQLN